MRVREWIIVAAIGLSGGCQWDMAGMGLTPKAAPAPTTRPVAKAPADNAKPPESYLAKNGPKESSAGQMAVESALNWANKYAQSMQTIAELQRESRDQQKESQALQQQNVKLQDDLAAAQKELKDANALLIEMRQELTKWKTERPGVPNRNEGSPAGPTGDVKPGPQGAGLGCDARPDLATGHGARQCVISQIT